MGFHRCWLKDCANLKTLYVGHSFIEEIYAHQVVDKEGQHAGTLLTFDSVMAI